MTLTNQYEQAINEALASLKFPANPVELYNPIRYTLENGGKRMRPQLVLMAADLISGDFQSSIQPALASRQGHGACEMEFKYCHSFG